MPRFRWFAVGTACLAIIPLLTACIPLTEPCYGKGQYVPDGTTSSEIGGHWALKSVDGNALPFTIPLSGQFNPGGAIRAYGGGLRLDTSDRYYDNDCSIRAEKGAATASYRYEEGGQIKPRGTYGGTFDFDRKQNTITLGAGGRASTGTVTRDATGNPIRITINAPVKKWGASLTFTLVFERTTDFAKTSIAPN